MVAAGWTSDEDSALTVLFGQQWGHTKQAVCPATSTCIAEFHLLNGFSFFFLFVTCMLRGLHSRTSQRQRGCAFLYLCAACLGGLILACPLPVFETLLRCCTFSVNLHRAYFALRTRDGARDACGLAATEIIGILVRTHAHVVRCQCLLLRQTLPLLEQWA